MKKKLVVRTRIKAGLASNPLYQNANPLYQNANIEFN